MLGTRTSHDFRAEIESRDAGLPFEASFHLDLRHERRCAHPQDIAASLLRRAVEQACGQHPATAVVAAQQDARAAAGRLIGVRHDRVVLRTADVRLRAGPEVLRQAGALAWRRAENDRADELLQREMARADTFRSHVLSNRSTAMAYWAMHHRDGLDKDSLNEISEMLESMMENERRAEPWRRVAQILTTFVAGLDLEARRTLLNTLAHYVEQFSDQPFGQQLLDIDATVSEDHLPTVPDTR